MSATSFGPDDLRPSWSGFALKRCSRDRASGEADQADPVIVGCPVRPVLARTRVCTRRAHAQDRTGRGTITQHATLGSPGWVQNANQGQTDDIPVHLRRLVALRDQTCQFPGGCDQPAASCEPHHVVHRADGGHTSLAGLKNYCWWHHHVVLHQMGWQLTVHPDGTSQVKSPSGKVIRSHSPPPEPG